jgi:hypothetical protein
VLPVYARSNTSDKPKLPTAILNAAGMKRQASSANFEIYTADSEKQYVNKIRDAMEKAYAQYAKDFGVSIKDRIKIFVFPEHEYYFDALNQSVPAEIGPQYVYSNYIGKYNYGSTGIYITPINDSLLQQFDAVYLNSMLYGLTIAFADEIAARDILANEKFFWYRLGLPSYMSGQLDRDVSQRALHAAVTDDALLTLDELEAMKIADFRQKDGIAYATSLFAFIDEQYSFKNIVKLYKSPDKFSAVFGISKKQFERQWHSWLVENYETLSRPMPPSDIMKKMPLQAMSQHFYFYAEPGARGYVERTELILEKAYLDLSKKLGVSLTDGVSVFIYRNFNDYFEVTNHFRPEVIESNYAFGVFNNYGIHLTIPTESMLENSERVYDLLVVHELVHALSEELYSSAGLKEMNLLWLVEGFADYVSKNLSREYAQNIIKRAVSSGTVPPLRLMEIEDYEAFIDMDGYTYGASVIEFIDATYGFNKVLEFYQNPGQYEKVFGFSKQEFEKRWMAFLEKNYK